MCGRKFTVKTVCMAAKQMVRHFPLSYCSVVFPPTSNVVLAMMPRLNPLSLVILFFAVAIPGFEWLLTVIP